MQAIRLQQTIEKDGEIYLSNLPVFQGQQVDVVVSLSPLPETKKTFTARQLLNSGLIGVWENRTDIKLRDQSNQIKNELEAMAQDPQIQAELSQINMS
ncbi:MAG: hypothetical protein ACK5Z3_12785 [Pseudanabaena sp.]|jgi:hypothetical protein